jgi:hypothetical protein
MPLDPQIVARYWLINWNSITSDHEKALNSWVDDALYAAMQNDADYAFKIIEAINEQDATQSQIEVFAAGPVENLLVYHGETVIQKVVELASRDANFARVLGGVWKRDMTDSVWEVVLRYRNTDIWADARS